MTDVIVPRGTGLLGGTFDPVHNGHVAAAEAALDALKLSGVDFLPAGNPWQKRVLTSAEDRAAMVRAAIGHNPRLHLNFTEIFRPGLTYTAETLEELRASLPPSWPLVLLIGQDQWMNFHTWKAWRRIAELAHIAVFTRDNFTGSPVAEVRDWAAPKTVPAAALTQTAAGSIAFFPVAPHAASSTEIRRLLSLPHSEKTAEKLEKWLPYGTAQYINRHGLYRPAR